MKITLKAVKLLNISVTTWFTLLVIGQFIFALHIIISFAVPAVQGNFDIWNENLPHGYEPGNILGNIMIGMHVLFAAIITFGGPIQFISKIRNNFPVFHKWNGRLYVLIVLLMSISGLYLHFSGRKLVGDTVQFIAFEIAAIFMIVFSILTIRNAIQGNFRKHRVWALRLFLLVSGGWFYRVGLMFWLAVNGGPVGFDFETFSGPFLTILSYSMHMGIVPLIILELFLYAQNRGNNTNKTATAIILFLLTAIMSIGIFAATMGLWF